MRGVGFSLKLGTHIVPKCPNLSLLYAQQRLYEWRDIVDFKKSFLLNALHFYYHIYP